MIGALYNGLSGVSSFSKGIDVSANNIANVNTVGYKSDEMSFARTLYSANSTGVEKTGTGVGPMEVEKDFSQGQLSQSSTYFDFAIEGKGFFIVNDANNDDLYYTRAGNFQRSLDGFLEDKNGFEVLGAKTQILDTVSTNGDTKFTDDYIEFISSQTVSTQDYTLSINSRATDYTSTASDIGTSGDNYKSRGTLLSDIDTLTTNYTNKLSQYASEPNTTSSPSTNQNVQIVFDELDNDLSKESSYIQVQVGNSAYRQNFDTDVLTTMNMLSDKISNIPGYSSSFNQGTNTLTIDNLIPGENTAIYVPLGDFTAPTINETLAEEGSGLGLVNSARDALKDRIEIAGGSFLDIQNTIPSPNQESISLDNLDLKLDSLELSDNNDAEFEATDDGILLLKQLGNTYVVGRLSTAYFADQLSLEVNGSNLYSETTGSGVAKNADLINNISTKFVETSNAELSVGLTEILQKQKAFEASAKSITTADEFLKTALDLKRS